MADPRISLGGFVEFASSTSSGRITAVRNVIANEFGHYEPSHDFYRQFRVAITEGIANGDDELRVRRAVDDCIPKRRPHYEALATGWNDWRGGKKLEVFSRPALWHDSGLDVRVSPQFTFQSNRETLLVWPHFKDAELSRDGIQTAIRLMELTYPKIDAAPAVLDVRRAKLHQAPKRPRRKGFDAWLSGEAAAFLAMIDSIRNVA
ncbi:hypothetical protein A5717_10335 [Mycolicibacterium porcinum]|uniref:hypothetical protein n=1 Tax=Mycolicibacterium porcinum TaxID=39693 RepID=UPI00080BECE5|nr:hypothetical protein [Mycolicibacterium porcinum]OCB14529.1 hypothetical protein A5717_10335 [Mycolicibacterium porcinum]